MKSTRIQRPAWALVSALVITLSGLAAAEPPTRAARLGLIGGTVSFAPAGQPDWLGAVVNRPLTTGDRLWTAADARAEVQIGGAAIRMGPTTSLTLLNVDDRITQMELSQGVLMLRVRSLGPRQSIEVATPNLAFTVRRIGEYRIEVDADGDATAVMVYSGAAQVYGDGASYTVAPRRAYRFYGTDLSDYEAVAGRRDDALDRWSRERDRVAARSVSARYVSSEVVGYEDLDAHGSWRVDAGYGNVWVPRRVASGWTPYRDGHWSWVDPWGWTWIDDAPWGYAVSHYGRWANIQGAWAWVPGPRRERAVYAPALVAFVGGSNFQGPATAGSAPVRNVGWFPLAPREVFQPSYAVSRDYFERVNRSNAVIAPPAITNVYNTTIVNTTTVVNHTTTVRNVVYANQRITNAVVAVPVQAFVQSQPVARSSLQVPREALASAPVVRVASVAPVQQSVQGGAPVASARPPQRERPRAVVVRTAPPPAPIAFAAQQQQLAARPGAPIDEAQRRLLKPDVPAAVAPRVNVVAAVPVPAATALPPPPAQPAQAAEARKAAAAQAGATRPVPPGDDVAKAEAARTAQAKADDAKAEQVKGDKARSDAAKLEADKSAATKAEAARTAQARADAAKDEAAKAANTQRDATKAEQARSDQARDSAARAEVSKGEARKSERASADAARLAAGKAQAARSEAGNTDASKAAAAQAEAVKAEGARQQAAQTAQARQQAAKADADKAQATRAEAARAAAEKAEAGKAQAAKENAARVEADRAAKARGEAAKPDAAQRPAGAASSAAAQAPRGRASGPRPGRGRDDEDRKQDGRRP